MGDWIELLSLKVWLEKGVIKEMMNVFFKLLVWKEDIFIVLYLRLGLYY